jgi:hypothetical protein
MDHHFTIQQQIACVQREIRLRQRVYPKRIRAEFMTAAEAAREIACMQAVLSTLQALHPQRQEALL